METYWFCSFLATYSNNNNLTFGNYTFQTNREFFPLKEVELMIIRNLSGDTKPNNATVLSFSQISKETFLHSQKK